MAVKVKKVRARYRHFNQGYRQIHAKTRIYNSWTNETIGDNFVNRRFRPMDLMRKALKEYFAANPELVVKPNNPPNGKDEVVRFDVSNMRWSQYAGCSCPCSPGFIVKAHDSFDVFVEFIDDKWEATKETPEYAEKRDSVMSRVLL
jgi:hypothetical protein